MKRKLIKQGTSTLMISLPHEWIKRNNLEKGSAIELEYVGNSILVKTDSKSDTKTQIALTISTDEESSIRAKITTAYRKGIDRVVVTFATESQYKVLQHIIKTRLLGYDIISRTNTECVVETIVEPSFAQFENIFRKIFFSFSELCDITHDHIAKIANPSDFEDVCERIQQYDNFCRRAISKNVLIHQKNEFLWAFLTVYVHASRELHKVNKLPATPKDTILIELVSLCQTISKILYKAYEKKDISLLDQIYKMQNEAIYDVTYKHFAKAKHGSQLFHIANCIRHLYLAISNLSGAILE